MYDEIITSYCFNIILETDKNVPATKRSSTPLTSLCGKIGRDLGSGIQKEDQKQIWHITLHCPINALAKESNYRLLMEWYMVPQPLSKFIPTPFDKCFW